MARELVIGLDLGTTNVKATVFNLRGKVVSEAEQPIVTDYRKPNRAEQNPIDIEKATILTLKNSIAQASATQDEIITVGISTAMHSLICVNEKIEPLSPMIVWSDKRSSQIAEKLLAKNGEKIYQKTGTPIHPMTPLLKLLWLKEQGAPAYREAHYFMSMKEFLIRKWFGKRMIDYSMASATGLFNVRELAWDQEALELAGVKEEQLSKIVPPTEILPSLRVDIAKEIGLSAKTPIVIGAADGQLANLGSGAIKPGEVNISMGTSGAIRQFVKGAPINDKMETFTYAFTDEMSIIGGPTNNGGIVLQWLKDLIEYDGSYDELIDLANNVDVGSGGITFVPYINGERAPVWDGRAKGNFYGLSINHNKNHLIRAVLEGIALNIYHISQSLENIAGPAKKISINGGLSKSKIWVQVLSDVLGKEISVSDTHHNASWGAAWTALVAIKKVDSFEAIKENLPDEKVIKPDMANHRAYNQIFNQYLKLINALKVLF